MIQITLPKSHYSHLFSITNFFEGHAVQQSGIAREPSGENVVDIALPQTWQGRWTAWRKAAVVAGIRRGAITVDEAAERYMLSREELAAWDRGLARDGITGLLAKRQRAVSAAQGARLRAVAPMGQD